MFSCLVGGLLFLCFQTTTIPTTTTVMMMNTTTTITTATITPTLELLSLDCEFESVGEVGSMVVLLWLLELSATDMVVAAIVTLTLLVVVAIKTPVTVVVVVVVVAAMAIVVIAVAAKGAAAVVVVALVCITIVVIVTSAPITFRDYMLLVLLMPYNVIVVNLTISYKIAPKDS